MPWGRAIFALAVIALVVGGMGSVLFLGSGAWRPDFRGTVGQDAALMAEPFEDLRAGRDDALLARLANVPDRDQALADIRTLREMLPAGAPSASRLSTWRKTFSTDGNFLWGVFEYDYPEHVVRAETTFHRATENDAWMLDAFNINVATHEELASIRRDFTAQPLQVQAVIVGAIVIPLFILATFLVALFRPGMKRRWLWLLMIALGLGTVSADLARAAISFHLVSFQLFGAAAVWSGSAFEGWIVSVSAPIGALWFWLAKGFSRGRREEEPDPAA